MYTTGHRDIVRLCGASICCRVGVSTCVSYRVGASVSDTARAIVCTVGMIGSSVSAGTNDGTHAGAGFWMLIG